MFIARIIETVVLAPILFVILTQMGDRVIFSYLAILLCFFGAEWLRKRIVGTLVERMEQRARDKNPTA